MILLRQALVVSTWLALAHATQRPTAHKPDAGSDAGSQKSAFDQMKDDAKELDSEIGALQREYAQGMKEAKAKANADGGTADRPADAGRRR